MTPEGVSKSFRQICLHDFSKVEGNHRDIVIKNKSPLYKFTVCMNDTLDAMGREQKILSFEFHF